MNGGLIGLLAVYVVQLIVAIIALVFRFKFYKRSAEEFGAYF